jgi:hypothetical protein
MLTRVGLAVLAFSVVGCSSDSDSDDPGGGGQIPAALSGYCTGTLERDMEVMEWSGPGAWSGSGATVPKGTTFLVGSSFDKWEGYLFAANGAPLQVDGDFSTGLVLGTDFSSSCATVDKQNEAVAVVLRTSTLYDNEALSGTPCTLPVGTVFTNYSYFGGNVATVTAEVITTECGFDTGYTDDLAYEKLLEK